MSQKAGISLSCQKATCAVCVVGAPVAVDVCGSAPKGTAKFSIESPHGVKVNTTHQLHSRNKSRPATKLPLNKKVVVLVTTAKPSTDINDIKVKVTYYGRSKRSAVGSALLYLTSVEVSLDVDAHRNGAVGGSKDEKTSWTWGPDGHGAVLLVNCDRDNTNSTDMDSVDSSPPSPADVKDMSLMILKSHGPDAIFKKYSLTLSISRDIADKVGVFQEHKCCGEVVYQQVLGKSNICYEVRRDDQEQMTFYVEGLTFPDVDFSGLVSVYLNLQERGNEDLPVAPIFTDEVVFRIAPWIMTPNTLAPLEVFVCSMPDNSLFLEELTGLVKEVKCKLTVCAYADCRSDRWIQDEMEFGYVEAPHKQFPVVFDSPRDGDLKDFPFKKVLGPDFGYVTREPEERFHISTLDSFGNLEVSPPVTVEGKEYPLGRILIGGPSPTEGGQKMTQVVRDFLHAQQVQSPLELWSDWLKVGHVDEFLSFVPAPDRKGFRLLLASTTACYKLLQKKKRQGHGDAVMFEGRPICDYEYFSGVEVKTFTINEILCNTSLKKDSEYVQSCIDWNRDVLKRELGLTEEDIIDIPTLFKMERGVFQDRTVASAFFPDMVNMIVLGKYLGIPKPFGPIICGKCCLEEEVRSLLEPLGLNCNFIDDFCSYHQNFGGVHCGTNVRRKPFDLKWWNMNL